MLSPATRASLLLEVVTNALRPIIARELPDPFQFLRHDSFAVEHRHLDSAACLRLLPHLSTNASILERHDLKRIGFRLIELRNDWAHQRDIEEIRLKRAMRDASDLLEALGDTVAADNASALISPHDDLEKSLDDLLRQQAAQRSTLAYGQALTSLGLTASDRRILYARLTASGALHRTMGAPLLCSLVVLGPDDDLDTPDDVGIPGAGYYWLVGISRDSTTDVKRTAHNIELDRIYANS